MNHSDPLTRIRRADSFMVAEERPCARAFAKPASSPEGPSSRARTASAALCLCLPGHRLRSCPHADLCNGYLPADAVVLRLYMILRPCRTCPSRGFTAGTASRATTSACSGMRRRSRVASFGARSTSTSTRLGSERSRRTSIARRGH